MSKITNSNMPNEVTKSISQQKFVLFLERMPNEKSSQLLAILKEGATFDKQELLKLYRKEDAEYEEYQQLLKENTISFLGGKNSKLFKITPSDTTQPPYVLKIENRFHQPWEAEDHVRATLNDHHIVPIIMKKSISCKIQTDIETATLYRTLIITEYCSKGEITRSRTVYMNQNDINDVTVFLAASLNIYTQLANIVNEIDSQHYAFPDMKNSNWGLDDRGTVRILDGKSMLELPFKRIYHKKLFESGYIVISSAFMNPPEMVNLSDNTPMFHTNSMHSYLFGKNLYQYLSGCKDSYLSKHNDGTDFDYSAPVFNNPYGAKLVQLIKNTVRYHPKDRLSMADVVSEIKLINKEFQESLFYKNQLQFLKAACSEIIVNLRHETSLYGSKTIAHYELKLDSCTDNLLQLQELYLKLEQLTVPKKIQCLALLKEIETKSLIISKDKYMQNFIENKRKQLTDKVNSEGELTQLAISLDRINDDPVINAFQKMVRQQQSPLSLFGNKKVQNAINAYKAIPIRNRLTIWESTEGPELEVKSAILQRYKLDSTKNSFSIFKAGKSPKISAQTNQPIKSS